MSEDTLRQDISRILEDVRGYTVSVSNEWIGHIIERVRAEDAVKSTGASLPWHVAIHNTGNAVAGKKISKQLRALVKTSSRYGHVYEKTGPLTYTCTGCGGRIYPFTDTVPGVRDHRIGVDGCIKKAQVEDCVQGTECQCSAVDKVCCPDYLVNIVQSDYLGDSANDGGNEAQPHSPLARPSNPPPCPLCRDQFGVEVRHPQPTLNQARRSRGIPPLNPTCSCPLCTAAHALLTERDTGHWGLD